MALVTVQEPSVILNVVPSATVYTTPLCVSSVAPGEYVVNATTITVVKVSFRDARAPAATVKKIAKADMI